MSREKQIDRLAGHIYIEAHIKCDNCDIIQYVNPEEMGERLYSVGWRITPNDQSFCPKCYKKEFTKEK